MDTYVTFAVWFYERLIKLNVVIVSAKNALKVYLHRKLCFILTKFDQYTCGLSYQCILSINVNIFF